MVLRWEQNLLCQVRERNACQSKPHAALIYTHTDLQAECRQLRSTVSRLKEENQKLTRDLSLLTDSIPSSKNSKSGASTVRVKTLEAELEAMRNDTEEFRKAQQKVICRYDDDLSAVKKDLERQAAKCKRLEEEKEEILHMLNSANLDLNQVEAKLKKTNTDLREAEREKEQLAVDARRRLEEAYGRKLREVVKAVTDFRNEFTAESPTGSSSSNGLTDRRQSFGKAVCDFDHMSRGFAALRDTVEDAWSSSDADSREAMQQCLREAGDALRPTLAQWHHSSEQDLLAIARSIDTAATSPSWDGRGVSPPVCLLLDRMQQHATFLYTAYLPCGDLWAAYADTVADVLQRVGGSLYGPSGLAMTPQGAMHRLCNVSEVLSRLVSFFEELASEQQRQPEAVADPLPQPLAVKAGPCVEALQGVAQKLSGICAASTAQGLKRHLSQLYTIDMSHYKKYKHKDSYTKEHRHLKQATDMTMQAVLGEISKISASCNAAGQAPNQYLTHYRAQCHLALLRDLVQQVGDLLLAGGDTRWFYPAQSQALAADLEQVRATFVRLGVDSAAVSKAVARTSAIVSGIMEQPTEELISGGSVCVAFTELPEEAKNSIWCRAIVRQVIGHRKDKKAKSFMTSKLGRVPK